MLEEIKTMSAYDYYNECHPDEPVAEAPVETDFNSQAAQLRPKR